MSCTGQVRLCLDCWRLFSKIENHPCIKDGPYENSLIRKKPYYPISLHRWLDRVPSTTEAATFHDRVRHALRRQSGRTPAIPLYTMQPYPDSSMVKMMVLIDFPERGPDITNVFEILHRADPLNANSEYNWSCEVPKEGDDLCMFRLKWFEETIEH
ncbi:hypothetical protein BJX99DRAFT_253970 [Aspergillus californicus]